jgi:hypothetical protein
MVYAWCFESGDVEDKIIKKWIPKSQCYVKSGLQDLPDYAFTCSDIRKFHVDVWNEKAKNYKRYGKFRTNYQLRLIQEQSTLEHLFGT